MSNRTVSEKNRGVFNPCPEPSRSGVGRERRLASSILKGGPVFSTLPSGNLMTSQGDHG